MAGKIENSDSEGVKLLKVALRQTTAMDHHTLDHHPMLAPLLKPQLELEQYIRILQTMYWIHAPLQDRFNEALFRLDPSLSYLISDRVSWLRDDLMYFGYPPLTTPCVPFNCRLELIESVEQLIGEIYVVEGSTLGGQVIWRLLQGRLAVTAHRGCSFFFGHGDKTIHRWREFWVMVERLKWQDSTACTDSARKLFRYLNDALSVGLTHWTKQGQLSNHQMARGI